MGNQTSGDHPHGTPAGTTDHARVAARDWWVTVVAGILCGVAATSLAFAALGWVAGAVLGVVTVATLAGAWTIRWWEARNR